MLEFKVQNVVESQDWDYLVETTYGRPYCFQQQDGRKGRGIHFITVPYYADDYENDTIPEKVNGDERGVSFKAWLARDPKQKLNTEDKWDYEHGLNLFWQRSFYPDVQTVANDLHNKGLIPEGSYIINIDW